MREALGHDADVFSNRRLYGGLVALGRATEAQSAGLAGEKWHSLGPIPQDGGSPGMELLALLKQLVQGMEEAKIQAGLCG
jgi:hypothetical protein